MGWTAIVISGMTFLFLLMSALLTVLWRTAKEVGRNGERTTTLAAEIKDIQAALDRHIRWHMNRRRET